MKRRGVGAPDFSTLQAAIPSLVDHSVGIVNSVIEIPRDSGGPDFFHFGAKACNVSSFTRQINFSATGGASTCRGSALAKAVGEAVERYCSAIYDIEDLQISSFDKAKFNCIDPLQFALYSAEQYLSPGFMFTSFNKNTQVRWTASIDPHSGAEVYVPASFVYMPYTYFLNTGDSPIVQPISTGLACHSSYAAAAISGICEVVERDAFTLTWQAMISPPRIAIDSLDPDNRDRVQRFRAVGAHVDLFSLSLDIQLPTVLAVMRGSAVDAPALSVATATDADRGRAVAKSLEELAHTRLYMQQIKTSTSRSGLRRVLMPDDVIEQDDHLELYTDYSSLNKADFLFSSPKTIALEQLPTISAETDTAALAQVVNAVRGAGYQPLIADLTSPDVKELGLFVCRAVIPGLHPLFMGYRYRALGGKRLWSVPQDFGHKGVSPGAGDNPAPHPFP